jgi:hypothetical protein
MPLRELYAYYMHNSNIYFKYPSGKVLLSDRDGRAVFANHLCERRQRRVLEGLVHSCKISSQGIFWLFDCKPIWTGYKGQPTDSPERWNGTRPCSPSIIALAYLRFGVQHQLTVGHITACIIRLPTLLRRPNYWRSSNRTKQGKHQGFIHVEVVLLH